MPVVRLLWKITCPMDWVQVYTERLFLSYRVAMRLIGGLEEIPVQTLDCWPALR